jgi:hypothetical protein
MTTLTGPKGTLVVGETTRKAPAPPKVPLAPMTTDWWLVAVPPTVMLFAARVPAAKPCTSMRRDVGAAPRKLNAVAPTCEL